MKSCTMIFIILNLYCLLLKAQEPSCVLKLNEKFPNFNISNFSFSNDEKVNLKEVKGKRLIIDFFSSNCIVCFKNLPKLNELQKDFKDELTFILIGKDDEKIKYTYKKFQEKYDLQLKVAFDSLIFSQLKINSFPFYVWIDENSIIKAITGPDELNISNIKSFISRGVIKSVNNTAEKIKYDKNNLFLINGNGAPDTSFLFRSVLSKWSPEMEISTPPHIEFLSRKYSFQILGIGLQSLYNYAYFGAENWSSKDSFYGKVHKVPILEVKEKDLFNTDRINGKNLFCYSLTVPQDKANKIRLQQIMQNDLKNYFGFDVEVVNTKMKCWVLKTDSASLSLLKSKSASTGIESTFTGFSLRNKPVSELIFLLWSKFQHYPPFIDETGIYFNIDLSIEAIVSDFNDLKKQLRNNGLYLSLEEKDMLVLKIKDQVPYL